MDLCIYESMGICMDAWIITRMYFCVVCQSMYDSMYACIRIQVGCAIVFPEFLETCRDHVRLEPGLNEEEYEDFERECFNQDGLALVE